MQVDQSNNIAGTGKQPEQPVGGMPAPEISPSATSLKSPGWLERKLRGFYRWRDAIKLHPVWGTGFALLMVTLGILGAEAVSQVKQSVLGPDEYLVQLSENQKVEFSEIKKRIGELKSTISGDNREALRGIEGAVESLEAINADLVQHIAMAKQEYETLQSALTKQSGVSGGYDFILAAGSGIRIDKTTSLGFEGGGWGENIRVNLTSIGSEKSHERYMSPGQSIAYKNLNGKDCKVSLLSMRRPEIGRATASFANLCS